MVLILYLHHTQVMHDSLDYATSTSLPYYLHLAVDLELVYLYFMVAMPI